MTKSWSPRLEREGAPTYIAIVDSLRSDIVSGQLLPGDRLPTHRRLAELLGVAVGTITRAYREAERQGLIHGEGRRGTFVGSPPEHGDERTGGPSDQSRIVNLSRFLPPAQADPDLAAALQSLGRRREIQHLMRYTCAEGYDYHRAAGARWITGLGMKVDADDTVMTCGAQHAIFLILLALADRGDVIAADLHTYPGIRFAGDQLGLEVIGIEGDDQGIDPDALASCCRQRPVRFLYLVPTFHNPTNTVLPLSRRQAIARIADKYGVDVIEDEINRKLLPNPPPLVKSLIPDRCYLVVTMAKSVAGGLRVAYVVPPEGRRDRLFKSLHTTALMVSPLLAEIAAIWINDGTADRSIAEKRRQLEIRNEAASVILKDFHFRSWPTSYFIWLFLPDDLRLASFEADAERERIVIAPASCFAVDKDRIANAARICLGGTIDLDTLKRSLEVLANILRGRGITESVVL
jgi:DNA-binding transcriptional MocR family regulator